MATYHGALHAYWEQGWEGRIAYTLTVEGQPHPFFLSTGQHLTVYAEDGSVLWQGRLRFVGRGREQHTLSGGMWCDVKQNGISYDQWIAWFVRQPPLRATVVDEPDTVPAPRPPASIGRGVALGATAGAVLATLYTIFGVVLIGLAVLLGNVEAGKVGDALLGFGALAICAGPFALIVGILPATLIGALLGLLVGLLCWPFRGRLTKTGGALIGLATAAAVVTVANLTVGPGLLRSEEGALGPRFLYLFWLGGPSLLTLGVGAWLGQGRAHSIRSASLSPHTPSQEPTG